MKLKRLREMREAQGLTQEELAELAHAHPGSVIRAEHGEQVRVTTARRYAQALGVPVSAFLEGAPEVPLAV